MKSLENFKPKLRVGKIVPKGTHLIYETQAPYDQLILPVESADFLVLCTGENSMSEIVETIYKNHGHVRFRTLMRTMQFLRDRGFIENASELAEIEDKGSGQSFMTWGPFAKIQFSRGAFSYQEYPALFYVISMGIILSAIFSAEWISGAWIKFDFIVYNNSYLKGLFYTLIIGSILLTVKSLLKAIMLMFLTGRAYRFSLSFNGFAFYLDVSSDSLFLVQSRLYTSLYHLATLLSPLAIASLTIWGGDNFTFSDMTLQIACLFVLFEFNPFSDSDFSKFIKSIYPDEMIKRIHSLTGNDSAISIADSQNENIKFSPLNLIKYFAIFWSAMAIYLSVSVFNTHLHKGADFVLNKNLSSLVVFYTLAIFGLLGASAAYNIYVLFFDRVIDSLNSVKNYIKHKSMHHKIETFNQDEVVRALEELPLFNYFPHELLNMLVQKSHILRFNKLAPVIVQGSEGKELFVLLSGLLTIQRRHGPYGYETLGEIHPHSIFGEIAVLEDCKRAADVLAVEESIVLAIPARILRQASEENQYIRELEGFRNAIVVNQFFSSAPFFKDLNERIVQMFISKGKFETFKNGAPIFKQGDPGNSFYLLLRGHVGVAVNGQPIARISQGGFFGEISLIADIPRTGTIYAQGDIQILQISRDSFWEILSQDLRIALFIESIGEMRIIEDIEILRGSESKTA